MFGQLSEASRNCVVGCSGTVGTSAAPIRIDEKSIAMNNANATRYRGVVPIKRQALNVEVMSILGSCFSSEGLRTDKTGIQVLFVPEPEPALFLMEPLHHGSFRRSVETASEIVFSVASNPSELMFYFVRSWVEIVIVDPCPLFV